MKAVPSALKLYDVTLRDGNHALRHQLESRFVQDYCSLAGHTPSWGVEVGHGNGLGGSSFLVGQSLESDVSLLESAGKTLDGVNLGVHSIPGFSTIERDLKPAVDLGVSVFRIASHVTEATVCEKQLEFVASQGLTAHGVLMMSHMVRPEELLAQAKQLVDFGASAVIIMDSAGHYRPAAVDSRIALLRDELDVELGFHAHNNLGLAVANAISAIGSGATIIDVATLGLGAGAGNAPYELLAIALSMDEARPDDFDAIMALGELVTAVYGKFLPRITPSSVRSGLLGVFSGYAPQVTAISERTGVPAKDIWFEAGKRKLVAGQESLLEEIAHDLGNL
jgi:4-hydroxy 2-oxovalerate aldolase